MKTSFSNITDTLQVVRLNLDTRNAPPWQSSDIEIYSADSQDIARTLYRSVYLPVEHELVLGPLEAVFILIRPSDKSIN